MANIKDIQIVINKELAKHAYEAGARWAFDDVDSILTIEGFEEYWNKMEREGNTVDTGSGQSNIPDVRRSAFDEIDEYLENSEYNYLNRDLIEFAERLKTHLACKMKECDNK